jgi:Reverse transcriptase (RNA-dependent DNA polymerase)
MVGINEERIPCHGNKRLLVGCPYVVGNSWVLTEKDDGTLRSRTMAQGFSQVPRKDFTHSYAPVIKDIACRLALII